MLMDLFFTLCPHIPCRHHHKSFYTASCAYCTRTDLPSVDLEVVKSKLIAKDVAFVAKRDVPQQEGQQALYFSARTVTNIALFIELKFKAGMNICKVTVRSSNKGHSELCKTAIAKIIN